MLPGDRRDPGEPACAGRVAAAFLVSQQMRAWHLTRTGAFLLSAQFKRSVAFLFEVVFG